MEMPKHPWEREGEEFAPTIEPNDLKIVWQFLKQTEIETAPIGGLSAVAFSPEGFKETCSPGADIGAVTCRAMMLRFLFMNVDQSPEEPEAQQLAEFRRDGELDERVFQVMARIPLGWIPKGGRQGFPFDGEEFVRQLQAA